MRIEATLRLLLWIFIPTAISFGYILCQFRAPWQAVLLPCAVIALVMAGWILMPQPRGLRGQYMEKTVGNYWVSFILWLREAR